MERARLSLDATSIRAMRSIHAAAMLEELKLVQVADRPSAGDLVAACDRWLSVAVVDDERSQG